jgi:hypothetical protein
MQANYYHGHTDGMPTVDAGNLSDLATRCSGSNIVLAAACAGRLANSNFNFVFVSERAGVGKSEKPAVIGSGHCGFCDLTGKKGEKQRLIPIGQVTRSRQYNLG